MKAHFSDSIEKLSLDAAMLDLWCYQRPLLHLVRDVGCIPYQIEGRLSFWETVLEAAGEFGRCFSKWDHPPIFSQLRLSFG